MDNFQIRRYVKDDIPQCIESIEQFLNENRNDVTYTNYCKDIDFDKNKVYNNLIYHLDNPDFFCNLIIQDTTIVGGLCAYIAQPFFSQKRIAYDQIFYTAPTFTSIKAVFQIFQTYIDWAKLRDCHEVRMCSSTGFKQHSFTTLCKRMKFQQFEIGFSRKI